MKRHNAGGDDDGSQYVPEFEALICRHLDRMSQVETNPAVKEEQLERVMHSGVLLLFDLSEKALKTHPEWARRWNDTLPDPDDAPETDDRLRNHGVPPDQPDAGDDDAEVGQPQRDHRVDLATRRAQRRVLIGALMESGVLTMDLLEPWDMDALEVGPNDDESGDLFDVVDQDRPPGIQASEKPDDPGDPPAEFLPDT